MLFNCAELMNMESTTSNLVKASILGILSLVAIVGNIIVCHILIKRRKVLLKNRATYQFILNLIFSDLIIGIFLCPFEITRTILGSWVLGTFLCKIIEFVEVLTSGTAVITHALIAIDRYRSLAHPHLPKLKAKRVRQMIALSWVVPAIVCTPLLYMTEVATVNSERICTPLAIPIPWLDKLYAGAEFVVMFFSPFCVICWCYYHVISLTFGGKRGGRIPTAKISLRRSQKRVTKTACLIVGAFIICWSPTFVLRIWRIASGTESVHHGHLMYEIAMFGGLINEAANPLIYTAYDRNMNVCQYIQCGHRVSNDGINETESSSRSIERHPSRSCRNTTRQLRFAESQS